MALLPRGVPMWPCHGGRFLGGVLKCQQLLAGPSQSPVKSPRGLIRDSSETPESARSFPGLVTEDARALDCLSFICESPGPLRCVPFPLEEGAEGSPAPGVF